MAVEERLALALVSAGDGKDAGECCEVIPWFSFFVVVVVVVVVFTSPCMTEAEARNPIRVLFSRVFICRNALQVDPISP